MKRVFASLASVLACVAIASTEKPSSSAMPAADPWKPITKWRLVSSRDRETKVGKIVESCVKRMIETQDAEPRFKRKYDHTVKVGFHSLQSLALMAALPHLAKSAGNRNADPALFLAAQNAIDDGMNDALKVTLPEYWESLKENAPAKTKTASALAKTAKKIMDDLGTSNKNYSVGVILMALEHYLNGGRDFEFDSPALPLDRPARPAMPLPLLAKRGIARLTTLLLIGEATPSEAQFKSRLEERSLWGNYTEFARSSASSCFSESSTAMMGLRAAISLGVADFEPEAFDFKLDDLATPMTKEAFKKAFLTRLSDVLVHCVLSVVNIRPDPPSYDQAIGVLGYDAAMKFDTERRALVPAKDAGSDSSLYRARYEHAGSGRRIVRIERNEDSGASLIPSGQPREAAYRYRGRKDTKFDYGCYHTAGAGYVLASALSGLPLVWSAAARLDPAGVVDLKEGQYHVSSVAGATDWTVKTGVSGDQTVTIDGSAPFTPVTFGSMPCRTRLAQCQNFILRQMSVGTDPDAVRKLTVEDVTGGKWWEAALSLDLAGHQVYFRGIGLYGILKFGLSLGMPDAMGNWFYFDDLLAVLDDDTYSGVTQAGTWAHNEFSILFATRQYRPLFGRDRKVADPPKSK